MSLASTRKLKYNRWNNIKYKGYIFCKFEGVKHRFIWAISSKRVYEIMSFSELITPSSNIS